MADIRRVEGTERLRVIENEGTITDIIIPDGRGVAEKLNDVNLRDHYCIVTKSIDDIDAGACSGIREDESESIEDGTRRKTMNGQCREPAGK